MSAVGTFTRLKIKDPFSYSLTEPLTIPSTSALRKKTAMTAGGMMAIRPQAAVRP